jgi:glycine cleavage system H lipoate-binding protein/ABC-type phosphate transport system substrate-binding protein
LARLLVQTVVICKTNKMNSNFKAMKKLVSVLAGVILLANCHAGSFQKSGGPDGTSATSKGSMTIASTPDLYNVATGWADEYSAMNPGLKVSVVSLTDVRPGSLADTDLALVSGESMDALSEGAAWKMVVGRDVIVPVINSANPFLYEIVRQGISPADFARTFREPGTVNWSTLLDGVKGQPAVFYLIDNKSITASIASFVGLDASSIRGNGVAGGPEMVAAVQKDPNAIGFCRLSDLLDPTGRQLAAGISLLPIDKNGNGRMDYIEKIYDNVEGLSRGIWIGKFPKTLSRNIYACAAAVPDGDSELAFLKFALTTGQASFDRNGFNSLPATERISKVGHLPATFLPAQTAQGVNLVQLLVTIAAGLILLMAILALVFRYRAKNRQMIKNLDPSNIRAMNENSLVMPRGLYFDKTHTWAFMEVDGTVRIGIDDFLQHVTGTITSIKLKNRGDKVKKGEPVLTIIQKGKRLTVSAPVSGIIRAENDILFTDPSFLNSSPYTQGWIYQIEPTNWLRETQFLFMAEKYAEWIKTEFSRLRDFLAHAIKPNEPEYAYVVLQDGGEIADHILENLGPEVWEDFQTQFIDNSK